MNAKFYPTILTGKTEAQAYKPLAMRYFILASLAKGETRIYLKNEADDVFALKEALGDLGVGIYRRNSIYTVTPRDDEDFRVARVDVKGSLLTLRMVVPILLACYDRVEVVGSGRLIDRDVTSGFELFKDITYLGKTLPIAITGKINAGDYMIEPNVNPQLLCALIMALPLVEGDSVLTFREKPKKQLSALIEMTVLAMSEFGVDVQRDALTLKIIGKQQYIAPKNEIKVEGDYSTAGYFLGANLLGGQVEVQNLNPKTRQTDKTIIDYLQKLKGDSVTLKGKTDYIFLLTALSLAMPKTTTITGVKLKEKDKMKFSEYCSSLIRLGGNIDFDGEKLLIQGCDKLKGGVMLDTHNDPRIAMSLIILSSALTEPVTILSFDAGMQEQASFINEFKLLGGSLVL